MVLPIPWLFLVAISGVVDSQYGQYVTYGRSFICALKGSTVTLGCSYDYPPYISNIFWTNKPYLTYDLSISDLTKDPQYQNRVQYIGDTRYDCSIELRDVMEQDQGEYFFIIVPSHEPMFYEGGVQLSVTDLQVEVPEKVTEGSAVTLTCKSTCPVSQTALKFTWYQDGDFFPTYTTDTNRLHLDSVSEKDGGRYSCGVQTYNYRSPAVALTVQSPEPTVSASVHPSDDIVEGSEVTLSCDCNPPALFYHWYKGSKLQYLKRTYTFSNISPADSGEYRCQCHDGYTKRSNNVTLNVQYPPRSVGVSAVPAPEVTEGGSVELSCTADANPPAEDYRWYKEGSPRGRKQTLTVRTARPRDSGEYKCSAQNKHGRRYSEAFQLSVLYPPRSVSVSVSPSGAIVEGDSVTLTCSGDANPLAHYSWHRAGLLQVSGAVLTIDPIMSEDAGEYSCECWNNLGRGTGVATLRVQYLPKSTSVSVSPSGDVVEGDSVTLTCSADAVPPIRDYTWLKGPEVKGNGQTHSILKVGVDDGGEYKCRVGNDHGHASATVLLDVKYPPRSVSASVSPSSATEGSSVTFTCDSDANPPVEDYVWYKNNVFQGDGRTYTVYRVSFKDPGGYKCQAKNQYGKKMSSAVTLNVLPQRNNVSVSVHPPGDVVEGTPVTLTCSGGADPSATEYAWYKGATRMARGRTYAFHRIGPGDAGDYKCLGEDREGDKFSIVVHLNVLYPPKCIRVSVSPSVEAAEGASVTLTCDADSNPPSEDYEWYKGTALVGTESTHSIHNLSWEDAGVYECKSGNQHGKKSGHVTLGVFHPPKSVSVRVSPAGGVMEGEAVTLTCSANAHPPVENYTWYTDDRATPLGSGQSYSFILGPGAGGRFVCKAWNAYGARMSDAVEVSSNVVSSSGNTVYIVVGIFCTGVAAVVAVLCCLRGRRQKRIRHEYENDNLQSSIYEHGHTPLTNLSSTPASGSHDGTYTALDPRTICPDYATLVTVKNNRPFRTQTFNQ